MIDNNFIVLDCETTGLEPELAPITQIAFLAISGQNFKTISKFETFVKPYGGLKLDMKILAKTTVKLSDIQKKGVESDLLVKNLITAFGNLKTKVKGDRALPMLVGHNIKFDINFIKYLFKLHNKDLFDYVSLDFFDTKRMADLCWKDLKSDEVSGKSLTLCCQRANIELVDAHGAMADVNATTLLFKYFTQKLSSENNTKSVEQEEETRKARNFYQF